MAKQDDNKLILYAGGLAILYFGVIRPILKKLGIQQTQEQVIAQQAVNKIENTPNVDNPFSPVYWKKFQGKTVHLFNVDTTNRFVKRLYDSMGYFSDDESAVFSVFSQMKYKTQVSWISDQFNRTYKLDLFNFLKQGKGPLPQAGLNELELQKIIKIVEALPQK
jgi:hypothetical protein